MGKQITLTLSDNIYRQIESMAQSTNQQVADVLSETIRQSFPPLHVNKNRTQMQQEVTAFEACHTDLWLNYPNQFVAFHQEVVVDYDTDELTLIERIDLKYQDKVVLIRQVHPKLPKTLRFRSPRFVKRS